MVNYYKMHHCSLNELDVGCSDALLPPTGGKANDSESNISKTIQININPQHNLAIIISI